MAIDLAQALAAKDALKARIGGLAAVHQAQAVGADHPQHNTVGVEVGCDPDGTPVVRLLVKEKLPAGKVAAEALAPREINGVPVRVEAVGHVKAFAGQTRRRVRAIREAPLNRFPTRKKINPDAVDGVWTTREIPALGGASIGHYRITAGTIGGLVAAEEDGKLLLAVLSNNHVLGNSNLGQPGDPILQPGAVDGGTQRDRVARLIRFAPLRFGGEPNQVDCAIGWTRWDRISPRHHSFTIDPEPFPLDAVHPGFPVMKDGRTTGHTSGTVVGLGSDVVVSYEPEGGNATFHNQLRIRGQGGTTFSQPGDSGSLIVSETGARPVALLFAGGRDADGGDSTFACPIGFVMEALQIERFLAAQA